MQWTHKVHNEDLEVSKSRAGIRILDSMAMGKCFSKKLSYGIDQRYLIKFVVSTHAFIVAKLTSSNNKKPLDGDNISGRF